MIRFFSRLLNYLLIACFLGSIWAGWYASTQGFGRKWRKKLSEEFARRGIEMTAQRLTLDPLRGLVAHNVRVYRDGKHRELVAGMNQLRLDINYTRLLQNEPFLDALILSEAEINLDLDPKKQGSGDMIFHHLSAEIYFQPNHLEVRRLHGEGLGVRFSVAGILEHATNWKLQNNELATRWRKSLAFQKWLENVGELKAGPKLGRLDLRLRGNLSQNQWLKSAECSLIIPSLQWRRAEFQDFSCNAEWTDGVLTVGKLDWRDDQGKAVLSGTWRPGAKSDFRLRSTIDGTPFFHEFGMLARLAIGGRTEINADILWKQSVTTDWRVVGELDARKPRFKRAQWDRLHTKFSLSKGRCLLSDFKATLDGKSLGGEILAIEDRFQANLTSTTNPHALWSTFAENPPSWTNEVDFLVNPWIKVAIEGPIMSPADWITNGEVILGRTNFRGVALTSGQAYFQGKGPSFILNGLQITRPEGQLSAEAFWKPNSLSFWNVRSTLDLVPLGSWIDESLAKVLATLKTDKNVRIEGDGLLTWSEKTPVVLDFQLRNSELDLEKMAIVQEVASSFPTPIEAKPEPRNVQATLRLGGGVFGVSGMEAVSEGGTWTGAAEWNFQTKLFSGFLMVDDGEMDPVPWVGQGPWERVRWHRR